MTALTSWALPAATAAQETPARPAATDAACPGGRISSVFIDNRSIYGEDEMAGAERLRWAYGLANSLHVRTRASFIEDELLFEVGDCLDPLLLEESGRVLRSYGFFARADVFSVPQADGTHHVVVDTQDEWTTKLDLGLSFDGGLAFEKVELTEENLMGRGILASAFYRSRKEQQDAGAQLQLPTLFGTRADARLGGGSTRIGHFFEEELSYPFLGEVGRFAFRQIIDQRDQLFPYALDARDSPDGFSHVLLPFEEQRVELSAAGRLGRPGRLTVLGVGASRERLRFGGAGGTQAAIESDFGNTVPAPPAYLDQVAPHTRSIATTRINLLLGQRNLTFRRVRGLDALDGQQDIRLGLETGLTLGKSVGMFRDDGLDAPNDLFVRGRLFLGADPGTSFVFANAGIESRHVFSGGTNGEGWRDVLAEVDVFTYLHASTLPGQTLFLRASAAGGWSTDAPFQVTLGGRRALRGFREEDFPGGQRAIFTLEDRVFVPWPFPDLFDMGFTVFGEAGRIWAGDVPFGRDSGWRGSAGAGLRFGFPSGTRGVVRVDLAFPIRAQEPRGPILRVTMLELLGLYGGFFGPQIDRSRRVLVGPELFDQVGR